MKKIPYYTRKEFNGIASKFTPAEAANFSRLTFPRVVRVPVDGGFRYFLRGFEVSRDEVFLICTEVKAKGAKPKTKPVIEVTRKGKNGRPAAVFIWGESKTGRPIEWMPRNGFSDYVCKDTGEHIARRTMSYSPRTGDDLIRSTWRLSHIPADAVMI